MSNRLILAARAILTQHRSRPILDGFVMMQGHRILQVGERRDLKFLPTVRLLDLGETLLIPGLINAHTHLDYTGFKAKVPIRSGFCDWLTRMARKTRATDRSAFRESIAAGIHQSLAYGTTTLCDTATSFESYGLLKRSGLRSVVFFEALDFGLGDPVAAWHALLERMKRATAFPPHPETAQWGISPHTPFTGSPELFRLAGRWVEKHRRIPTSVHVAESREERALFARNAGPLARRRAALHPDWTPPRGGSPVRQLSLWGWLPKLDLAVHCNAVDDRDLDLLARHRIGVVHCPGSHAFFGHPPFRYKEFKRRGIAVALGTDSLASNGSLSLFREMRLFRKKHPEVSAQETLSLATDRAARALGRGGDLGQVRPGYLADLIGIPLGRKAPLDTEGLCGAVVSHPGEVSFSMVHGEVRFRLAVTR